MPKSQRRNRRQNKNRNRSRKQRGGIGEGETLGELADNLSTLSEKVEEKKKEILDLNKEIVNISDKIKNVASANVPPSDKSTSVVESMIDVVEKAFSGKKETKPPYDDEFEKSIEKVVSEEKEEETNVNNSDNLNVENTEEEQP